MNRFVYILTAILTFCGQMALYAQTYDQVLRSNLWNRSTNITGIRQDSLSRSYAELTGGFESGGFKESWQADKSWTVGARTESIRHFEKISFKGGFSFTQWEGYGMCGSMFTDPGYYPIDVLEFTPGRKTLQTYALDGGLSYDLNQNWRLGVMADFASANMAKRKDLRHTNWKLDFSVAPAFMYQKGDFAAGLSYIYRKTGETVNAEQVGTAESSYYAFFDKGLMYGVYQVWTGSGVHLDEAGVNRLPVKEYSNGLAVQMQYKGLFAEAEYARTRGSVGEKEYIWFRFPGNMAAAHAGYKAGRSGSEHYARLDFEWKSQALHESVLEKISENGVTIVEDHGSNLVQQRDVFALCPSYEYVASKWEVSAGADFVWKNGMTSQIYPYIYTQSLSTVAVRVGGLARFGGFELSAQALYGCGAVREDQRAADTSAEALVTPFRLQEWYELQKEYDTAAKAGLDMILRYNFKNGLYIKAAGGWLHGFDMKYISGADRCSATLGLGYEF